MLIEFVILLNTVVYNKYIVKTHKYLFCNQIPVERTENCMCSRE